MGRWLIGGAISGWNAQEHGIRTKREIGLRRSHNSVSEVPYGTAHDTLVDLGTADMCDM